MADGSTINFSFTLPDVGGSDGSWGGKINTNFSTIDSLLGKTLRAPISIGPLPSVALRAGKVFGFDSDGNPTPITIGSSIDPSLRSDLALSTGASLVSMAVAGTGAVSRSIYSKLSDFVSVKDFGAVGDGATNDTAAFAAAIAAKDKIYIPQGTFLVNIDLSNLMGKTLLGAGKYSTFLKNYSNASVIRLGNEIAPCQLHHLEGFTVDNRNKATYPNISGIEIAGLDVADANQQEFHTFNEIRVINCKYGIEVSGKLIWASFNQVDASVCQDGLHIWAKNNVSQLTFTNCRFGTNTGYGVYMDKSFNDPIHGTTFIGCTFENNGLNGFRGTGTVGFSGLVFINPYFEFNGGSITAGTTSPRKANVFIDATNCLALNTLGGSWYGNTSVLDWNLYVSSATTGSGMIGSARTGIATNGFCSLPPGFIVMPLDGGTNTMTLPAGSFNAREFTSSTSYAVTLTLTGCTTAPTGTARVEKVGNVVTVYFPVITGTSNATTCALTGLPSNLFPARAQTVLGITQDGSSGVGVGSITIGTDGVITLFKDASGSAFAATGTKGIKLQTITFSLA